MISLKEANRQRCRPGRRRNARQGHTCASLAPQNRPKGPRLLAPRTTSDIRGEIVPGDGASLVSFFLDSLSLPTSPLATTMVSSLLTSECSCCRSCRVPPHLPILSLTMWGNQGGERGLFLVGPGGCRYGRPTHINSTDLSSYTPPSHSPRCTDPLMQQHPLHVQRTTRKASLWLPRSPRGRFARLPQSAASHRRRHTVSKCCRATSARTHLRWNAP